MVPPLALLGCYHFSFPNVPWNAAISGHSHHSGHAGGTKMAPPVRKTIDTSHTLEISPMLHNCQNGSLYRGDSGNGEWNFSSACVLI